MNKVEITIQAEVNSTIEKVWERYSKPEHITKWNFASDDWCCPAAVNELHPGGKLNWRMEAKDGSFGFDFEAVYDEVILHKKIAYTMLDGRKAVTTFQDQNGKVAVTTTFDAETMNSVELQQQGWQAILNNFKKHAESK
ncbi:MAG: hypothetical protein FMNOHCHN_00409 [Ignavibacteriaceae bacterium]|nr:hypothetical protein [Ignavibacteriaceae bacterium]